MGQIPSIPTVRTQNRTEAAHSPLWVPQWCSTDGSDMQTPTVPQNLSQDFGICLMPSFGMEMKQPHWAGTGTAFNARILQEAAALHSLFQAVPIAAGWQGMARSHSSPWNALGHSLSSSLSYSKTTWTEGTGTAQFHFYPHHCCLCWHLSHCFTEVMNNETSSNLHNHLQCLQDKHTSYPNWLSCL